MRSFFALLAATRLGQPGRVPSAIPRRGGEFTFHIGNENGSQVAAEKQTAARPESPAGPVVSALIQ
jgi:hypothetical protein